MCRRNADVEEDKRAYEAAAAVVELLEQTEDKEAHEAAEAVVVQQELESTNVVCGICCETGNQMSFPCCRHIQAACISCYETSQRAHTCPYCRGPL